MGDYDNRLIGEKMLYAGKFDDNAELDWARWPGAQKKCGSPCNRLFTKAQTGTDDLSDHGLVVADNSHTTGHFAFRRSIQNAELFVATSGKAVVLCGCSRRYRLEVGLPEKCHGARSACLTAQHNVRLTRPFTMNLGALR